MVHKFIIYDHETHPIWMPVYRAKFEALGKTNGAYTYSQDIKNYHLSTIMREIAKTEYEYTLISTVGRLSPGIVPPETQLIIYYLHENTLREIPRIKELISWYKGKIIFITARIETVREIQKLGISAIHLPLSIETSALAKYAKKRKYTGKRVIYFGNKYLGKDGAYDATRAAFESDGWQWDEISNNQFNGGERLSRREILKILANYKYGVGEGRCYLEMNALGIKTFISCARTMGLITNEEEFEKCKLGNFSVWNGYTFSNDLKICVANMDKILIKSHNVLEVLPMLKEQISQELK